MFKKKQPFFQQLDMMDCGPTCLKMIAGYYGRNYSLQYLRDKCYIDRQGVSVLGISDAAEKIGMRTMAVKATFELLRDEAPLPCIAYWQQRHFVVVYEVKKGKGKKPDMVYVADPATGMVSYTKDEFCQHWSNVQYRDEPEGVILILEPTPEFYRERHEGAPVRQNLSYFFKYLIPYKPYIIQLFIGLLTGSILSLIFPFLTQALVDFGINNQDMNFVYIILVAQLMLFAGRTVVELLRSWILLHISARVNIFIISDFLIKLMKLPIAFFDSKNMGDILQRIQDHQRLRVFLTSSSLESIFSLINLLIFGTILFIYSLNIFLVFLLGSVLYIAWVLIFMEKRRQIDYKRFNQLSANQSNEVQLVTGMQEIKLNNCEKQKRWEWEDVQIRLFKLDIASTTLSQYQNVGASMINEFKNIMIIFMAAREVIGGGMTLGMMMSITYILGHLNSTLLWFVTFIKQAQDAKISLERSGEIHNREDEEDEEREQAFVWPEQKDLVLQDVVFRYGDPNSDYILKSINLNIPHGKTTAIVGASGSGKTTLLKLLLKFYEPENGEVRLGEMPLRNLNAHLWRNKCGAVMQDGYIFSDTIARNIALGNEKIDKKKLLFAADVANIKEFIEGLPLNYNTRIGNTGVGLSQGQKQRILIARAVYKDPEFLFFDEATSALDANNEKEITAKLDQYCQGRTVVVIAHRLSTVRNAHQIVVLQKGEVAETGTHEELVRRQGLYFHLIKNQLELGN